MLLAAIAGIIDVDVEGVDQYVVLVVEVMLRIVASERST